MNNEKEIKWPYHESEIRLEGTELRNDKDGYTRWWYQRYIVVDQFPNFQNRVWMRPHLTIRSMSLSVDSLETFSMCLEKAMDYVSILNQRTGKSIEENNGIFERK